MWVARCLRILLIGFLLAENSASRAEARTSSLEGNTRARKLGAASIGSEIVHAVSHGSRHSLHTTIQHGKHQATAAVAISAFPKAGEVRSTNRVKEASPKVTRYTSFSAFGSPCFKLYLERNSGNQRWSQRSSQCFNSTAKVSRRIEVRSIPFSKPMVVDFSVTTTLTHTVTTSGPTTTSLVISTVTQTLTFIDPAAKTQTANVTITSCARITPSNLPTRTSIASTVSPTSMGTSYETSTALLSRDILPENIAQSNGELRRRQEFSRLEHPHPTSTVTVGISTTFTSTTTISKTRFNTIFVTTIIAPNATTTIFITTTTCSTSSSATETGPSTTSSTWSTFTTSMIPTTIISTNTGTNSAMTKTITNTNTNTVVSSPTPPITTLPPSLSSSTTSLIITTLTSSSPSASRSEMTSVPLATAVSVPTSIPSSLTKGTTVPQSSTSALTGFDSSSNALPPTTTLGHSTSQYVPTMSSVTTSSTSTTATGTATSKPQPAPGTSLSSDQIAALVVGLVLLLVLLIVIAVLLYNGMMRRRKRLAEQRNNFGTPAASSRVQMGASNGMATDTNDSGGEGQVRIVIRPVPRRRAGVAQFWPMPPGQSGRRYTFYVEQTTTGETTPRNGELSEDGTGVGGADYWSNNSGNGSQIAASPTIATGPASAEANRTRLGSSRLGRAI